MIKKNESGLFETDIEGHKYEFEKWGAEDATDVLLDIATLVGKPLGVGIATVVDKLKGDKLDEKIDPNLVGSIVEAMTEKAGTHKAMVKGLIKKLSSEKVLVDGKPIAFNSYYQDRLDLVFKVVSAALEVQYGNFFAAITGPVGLATAKGLINRV